MKKKSRAEFKEKEKYCRELQQDRSTFLRKLLTQLRLVGLWLGIDVFYDFKYKMVLSNLLDSDIYHDYFDADLP